VSGRGDAPGRRAGHSSETRFALLRDAAQGDGRILIAFLVVVFHRRARPQGMNIERQSHFGRQFADSHVPALSDTADPSLRSG
jgi:hypothetical protein